MTARSRFVRPLLRRRSADRGRARRRGRRAPAQVGSCAAQPFEAVDAGGAARHKLWLRTFPNAEVTRLEDAVHFLQEDAHERIVPELLRFLAQHADRNAVDQSTLER
jgi:pimeloyl-ACP methyl ester carboxylesterase